MQNFVRGQRAPLAQICDSTALEVNISLQSARVSVFDFVCFGLDEREQLNDDRYMVFFNQKHAPANAITLARLEDQSSAFTVDVNALPAEIARLVFTVSVDGAGTMRDLQSGTFTLGNTKSAAAALEFRFGGSDFDKEGALMLAALYRKDGVWRFWAQGQGFVGDLSALLQHFGGEESETNGASATANEPLPTPSPPLSAPVALSTSSAPLPPPPISTATNALQQSIAQAVPGSTITLPRGEHQGPIYIDKPLILEGEGAVIWAQNGPVFTVQSVDVTLRDVEIEVTAPEAEVPHAGVALWIAPGVGTQLQNVRARGEIIGVTAAEGDWKLPPFLELGEFAPRAENRFYMEIETPHACELKSGILGVSLHPAQLTGGRHSVEIRVQNVAPDTLLVGVLECSTGGIARTIPLSGRSACEARSAVENLRLWTSDAA